MTKLGKKELPSTRMTVTAYLVHTADANKTRLSRLVGVGGVNWVGDSRRQFSVVLNILKTEQFCPVSSAVWTHLWTSVDPDSKYDVTIGNHYVANWKLGQDKTRFSSNRISRLDETVSKFSVADSLDLSPIQFTPRTPRRQDKTACLVGVDGVN